MPDSCRILVADDETQMCRLVRDTLIGSGYAVDIAQDGHSLLEHYHSGEYALLILDTLLVQASGLEVVMKLRDRGDRVPIILMFGREPERVEPFAFTYRIDVLRKPFGLTDLRSAVGRALGENTRD